MKKLFLLLLLIPFIGCDFGEPEPTPPDEADEPKIEVKKPLDYNEVKNEMILTLINETPISKKHEHYGSTHYYVVTFKTLRIEAYHHEYVPYENSEGWEFFGTYLDGRHLILNSHHNVTEHKLAPETYEKLKIFFQSFPLTNR